MLFDLRPGLVILLIYTRSFECSDIEDFKSFLPSEEERGNYEKSIESSPYMRFTQYGNNFFFKPRFDLGPKYVKPYKQALPTEPILTKYVEADLKQEVKFPESPAIVEKQNAEIIPIAKIGKDTQVILGHAEPLPEVKGSLNIRELLPILYQFIQPYLPNNAQVKEDQKQISVNPYRSPEWSQGRFRGYREGNHRICGPMCDRRQGFLIRDTLAQTPDGGYIPYL